MKKEIEYTDEPMIIGPTIPDFLPPPGKLVFKVPREKITVELFKPTLDYFKAESEKLGVPYVHLIRAVLGAYAEGMQKK